MVVEILGPMIGVAVAVTLVPDPWFEPLLDIFYGTSGANGFWPDDGRARCTLAVINTTAYGERSPYA